MTKEDFEKMDESLMKNLKSEREKEVPPKILEGFSASVLARIREKEKVPVFQPLPWRFSFKVAAPVFAVIVIAFVLVSKTPQPPSIGTAPTPSIQLASVDPADIDEQIALLQELGVWTEEDEAILAEYEDLELTHVLDRSTTVA